MANTFITPQLVARDAAIVLHDRLMTGNMVSRAQEGTLQANKIGDTVKVTVPGIFTAEEFTGTTNAQNVTETEVDLTLEHHYDVRADLTSKQKSLELDTFTRLITIPAMDTILDSIDTYFIQTMLRGFARNVSGTAGTDPSTLAHIIAGRKILQDNKIQTTGRVALIDTTAEASFLNLAAFADADFGGDGPIGRREGNLPRRLGFNFFADPNAAAHDRGDIAGTVLTDGVPVLAATTVHLDGFTDATGTVNKGTRFTVAGDTQVYTVTADLTLAGSEGDIPIYPAVSADLVSAGNDAAVTFAAALQADIVYHPDAVAAAIVAPSPLNIGSAVESFQGISVRVSMSSSTVSLSDSIVYDVFCGAQVIQPAGGVVFQG